MADDVGIEYNEAETVAPRASVTSDRFVSPHLLEAIPHPSEYSENCIIWCHYDGFRQMATEALSDPS